MDNKEEFQFDFNRIYDREYIFSEHVFRYLFEKRYNQASYMYGFDGGDPEHFLYDKTESYESFKMYMERQFNTDSGKPNIDFVIHECFKENSYLKKFYYYITCVVCMQKKTQIIFEDCGHFCLCLECFDFIMESTLECPLCREPITDYRIGLREKNPSENTQQTN